MENFFGLKFLRNENKRGPGAFFLCGLFLVCATARGAQSLQSWVTHSSYTFVGKIKKIGAATESIPAEDRTAVVTVVKLLDGDPTIGDLTGKDVTLRLLPGEKAAEGDSLVFFTSPYTFRKTVGLSEVASQPAEQADALSPKIIQVHETLRDRQVQARLKGAELVVEGTVGKITPTDGARIPSGGEHDALWWQAEVRVDTAEKGSPQDKLLTVFFAKNNDSTWFKAPKLTPGERAEFLLRKDDGKLFGVSGYFVSDPADVVPLTERPRVLRLLKVTP